MNKDKLSASEALFGFCGWLTTRKKVTTMSSHHSAAPIAENIKLFCKIQGLVVPREHWDDDLISMKEFDGMWVIPPKD